MNETKQEVQPIKLKEKRTKDEKLEIIIAIILGITALLTAWASWIGSLHGGNQATNYTKSSNISADANERWNAASQAYLTDLQTWNTISSLLIDIQFAEEQGDTVEAEKNQYKLDQILTDNTSEEFMTAIEWAMDQEEYCTPFEMEGYFDSYYADASACLAEAEEVLKQGQEDNANGDRFGLVTVFYSVVMFLLGIVGTFKRLSNKYIILIIAGICFILATIIMVTIPLPTGFSLASFFGK